MSSGSVASSLLGKVPKGAAGSKRQRLFEYIKTKKDEYWSNDQDVDGFDDSEVAITNPPFPGEKLMLYPSYTFEQDNEYHVEVRGYLYVKGEMNRRNRLVLSLAKQYAGLENDTDASNIIDTSSLSEEEDESVLKLADDLKHTNMDDPKPIKKTSTSSSLASSSASTMTVNKEENFAQRVAPFFYKAATHRQLCIQVGTARTSQRDQVETFTAKTNASGRFAARCVVPYEPSLVHVEASKDAMATEDAIVIGNEGISVITDIDDTIRRTGINGDRREVVRNVFVRDFRAVAIDGVVEWYNKMADKGCKFHYVSNAPWALFSTASDYIKDRGFPPGSIHLKRYNSILGGLFEPAEEKKRTNLFSILRDFPQRQFILVGDSGEHDLEAYTDLAMTFPQQILAIYIRDVTSPKDDDLSAAQYVMRPDEIDNVDLDAASTSSRHRMLRMKSSSSLQEKQKLMSAAPPPPPPRLKKVEPKTTTTTTATTSEPVQVKEVPDLIDLSDAVDSKHTYKKKPVVPRKPVALKPTTENNKTPPPSVTPPPPPPPPPRRPNSATNNGGQTPLPQQQRSVSSTVTQSSAPPLPPRPSSSETRSTPRPPPTPARPSPYTAPNLPAYSRRTSEPVEHIDEDTIDYNYRVEEWKMRVARARERLPNRTRFRMWRHGEDIEEESLLVIDSQLPNVNNGRNSNGQLL